MCQTRMTNFQSVNNYSLTTYEFTMVGCANSWVDAINFVVAQLFQMFCHSSRQERTRRKEFDYTQSKAESLYTNRYTKIQKRIQLLKLEDIVFLHIHCVPKNWTRFNSSCVWFFTLTKTNYIKKISEGTQEVLLRLNTKQMIAILD